MNGSKHHSQRHLYCVIRHALVPAKLRASQCSNMPTISRRAAEASDDANKSDNVPAAASASTAHYDSCAASAMPQDAASPPFHPNTAPGKHLPTMHQQGVVVGGKTPPLASKSVEVGEDSTSLKSTPLASIPTTTGVVTATHTLAATDSMLQRCNRTIARSATSVDITPTMVPTIFSLSSILPKMLPVFHPCLLLWQHGIVAG